MTRKTKKMIAIEAKRHQSLEEILPEMVTEQGLSATAEELGVSKATLGYWLLKFNITIRRIALRTGETFQVIKASGNITDIHVHTPEFKYGELEERLQSLEESARRIRGA